MALLQLRLGRVVEFTRHLEAVLRLEVLERDAQFLVAVLGLRIEQEARVRVVVDGARRPSCSARSAPCTLRNEARASLSTGATTRPSPSVASVAPSSVHDGIANAARHPERFGGGTRLGVEPRYWTSTLLHSKLAAYRSCGATCRGASWATARPSVANRIPETIVATTKKRIEEGTDFHAYIVIPMFPEGDPVSSVAPDQRQFEWNTMSFMAKEIAKAARAKGKEWTDYLTFYFLANWNDQAPVIGGDRKTRVRTNRRYMVYVHSKLMIVDDDYLIVGSANLNERSLAGDRDTEICVYMFADHGKTDAVRNNIQKLRNGAWSEHYGGGPPPDWDHPEKSSCSSAMRTRGLDNWVAFANGTRSSAQGHLVAWPFVVDAAGTNFFVQVTNSGWMGAQDMYIFDAAADAFGTVSDLHWIWASPLGGNFAMPGSLAE